MTKLKAVTIRSAEIGPDIPAMHYLTWVPTDRSEIPDGLVLVHNRLRPNNARRLGLNGFRAWTQVPDDRLALCDCGWALETGPHYRVGGAT